jgi:hypothetical protein
MSELLYVLAGTYDHARDYAYRNHGVHYSRIVNVDKPDKLRGIRGLKLYVTRTAVMRHNYDSLIQMAVERQMDIEYV